MDLDKEERSFTVARRSLSIIPTYNEAQNVPKLLEHLRRIPIDVLFIDDHSTDGTAVILRQAATENPEKFFLLERPGKMGLGTAYVTGFKWAIKRDYERILEMDADLSHNPDDILRLIAAAETYDLAVGSRYIGGIRVLNWSLKRLMLSLGAAKYVRVITGLPLTDPTSGFKCFRREVLESLDLDRLRSRGYSFQIEIHYNVWMKGFVIGELPIVFTERVGGVSKMSSGIVFEAVWVVWKLLLRNWLRRRPRKI